MKDFTVNRVLGLTAMAVMASACASAPKAPFDVMKNANVTAFRLQNYEPPAAAVAAPTAPTPGAPLTIPGLPPEIQAWAQQALPGLQALIPPGILPNMPGVAPAPAPAAQVPRFVDFRILGQAPVMSNDLKEQLGDLFGNEDNFQAQHNGCMYPEMGLNFVPPAGAPQYQMLVSFSCNQVNAVNFQWPHKASGMTPEMVKSLSEIVPKLFANSWPAQPAPAAQNPQPVGTQFNVTTGG